MLIESSQNQTFKNLLKFQDKKFRNQNNIFLVEGKKQVAEIPKDWTIKQIIISKKYKKFKNFRDDIILSERLFAKLSSTKSPQGIIAVVEKKYYKIEEIIKQQTGFFIVLENIQDPGNLGTIIRSADAFGAKAIFVSLRSVDIYSDKTIRSTMGSLFHLPVVDNVNIEELLYLMKKERITVFAGSLKGKKSMSNLKIPNRSTFIIGNEANGIKQETEKLANVLFKIPIPGKAESLNAAVAASIIMYELSKNNKEKDSRRKLNFPLLS
ncbi:MAG: RNA methyltransferase [Endomicrobium sp.]|jgi:TrmH family RNA methyltransferase|nr:RNA methyltransferase [Endomicrobium sp.]